VAGLILILAFLAGYAVQRGSICAVGGVEKLVVERRPERFLGFFVSGAVALAILAIASLLGHDMFGQYRSAGVAVAPIIGGTIFGAGALLNGACAFGTVARLGRGDLARIGTLSGILVGFALASRTGIHAPPTDLPSPLLGLPSGAILFGSLVAVALIGIALHALPVEPRGKEWNPVSALVLIGLINGILLIISPGWPYTNLLMDLAGSTGMLLAWRSVMSLTFIAGAVAGAFITRQFRPDLGAPRRWTRCFLAGLLMGAGATLVPGGNDTMLLVGLPLLLSSFVLAYAAMVVTMALILVGLQSNSKSTAAA